MEVKCLEDTCFICTSIHMATLCVLVNTKDLNNVNLWHILTLKYEDQILSTMAKLSTKYEYYFSYSY